MLWRAVRARTHGMRHQRMGIGDATGRMAHDKSAHGRLEFEIQTLLYRCEVRTLSYRLDHNEDIVSCRIVKGSLRIQTHHTTLRF